MLQVLNLARNLLTRPALDAIIDALEHNMTITTCEIAGNPGEREALDSSDTELNTHEPLPIWGTRAAARIKHFVNRNLRNKIPLQAHDAHLNAPVSVFRSAEALEASGTILTSPSDPPCVYPLISLHISLSQSFSLFLSVRHARSI